jgi:hypothetical protein
VTGRATAPQIVVVHRGQIVVDERVSVYEFEGARRADEMLERRAESPARRQHERGAQTFAAREETPTHRLVYGARLLLLRVGGHEQFEMPVDEHARVGEIHLRLREAGLRKLFRRLGKGVRRRSHHRPLPSRRPPPP